MNIDMYFSVYRYLCIKKNKSVHVKFVVDA